MNNEHLGGEVCRSPHLTHHRVAIGTRMAPAAMGGLCPPPCVRLPLARASLCSGLNAVCSRIAKRLRRLRARPSLRRASPPPPVRSASRSLRSAVAVASAPPARGRPPSGGPPARARGAAGRPRRVPLRGARRICPGFGRRSSAPSAAQSARAVALASLALLFSLRARGAAGAGRSLSAA